MVGASVVYDFSGGTPLEPGLTQVAPADGRVPLTSFADGETGEWNVCGYYADLSRPPLDWRIALRFEPELSDPSGLREAAELHRPTPLLEPPERVSLTRAHPALAGPLPCQGIAA